MNLKYSIRGQIISVVFAHLKTVSVLFLIWLLLIALTISKIGGIIYSVIATSAYVITMYSESFSQAKNDKKSYSPLTPKPYKGLLLPLGVIFINILVTLIHIFALRGAGETLNLSAISANVLYLFWFSPFISFLDMQKGAISTAEYAVVFVLPLLSCFFGYFAGYKNFNISDKLRGFMYEKK